MNDVVIMLAESSIGRNATRLLVSENNCGEENGDGSTKIRLKAYKKRPGRRRYRGVVRIPVSRCIFVVPQVEVFKK